MKRVLLAWELGRGRGHAGTLLQLARSFVASGHHVVVALRELSFSGPFIDIGAEVVQTPVWPFTGGLGIAPARTMTSTSMGDMLACVGFAYEAELEAMLRAWMSIMRSFKIDLVVAEFAPAAGIAALGRLPLAMIGTGYSLPPAEMREFPKLHDVAPLAWVEEQVLASVNAVLSRFNGRQLDRLPHVFEADVHYVMVPPALDPYAQYRSKAADGPMLERLPDLASRKGRGVFTYLSPGYAAADHLIDSLALIGPELTLFAPSLSENARHKLLSSGARCLDSAIDLVIDLAKFRLVIHYGVATTSSIALLAGVPQLALSLDIEKELNGQALEALGVGKLVKIHNPSSRIEPTLIGDMLHDEALAAHCREVAIHQRQAWRPEAFNDFFASCIGLAG